MDRNSQTTGSDQRSAIGGTQPRYGFPKNQLNTVTENLDSYVLIGPNGQLWTSAPDAKQAHQFVQQAMQQVQPEGVGG